MINKTKNIKRSATAAYRARHTISAKSQNLCKKTRFSPKSSIKKGMLSGAGNIIFTFIAFGLTIISAYNGFKFYRVLFGVFMSALISSTFELARMACLFKYRNSKKKIGSLTFALYTVTALVCAFASINSFTAEVIIRDRVNEKETQAQIYKIKNANSKNITKKIDELNNSIKYLENQAAKYPDSNYWKRRLSQYLLNRDKIILERDSFLNLNPENPEQWLRTQSPLLGLEIKNRSQESEEMTSVKLALKEVWGLSGVTTQKIIGIVVTITVELCILLFAILATERRKVENVIQKITGKKSLLEILKSNYGEKLVERLCTLSKKHFEKTGRLPPMNQLSLALRPILDYLKNIDKEHLKELFEK